MRLILLGLYLGAISPALAEPQPDPRLDLLRPAASVAVGPTRSASPVTTSSAVRTFARLPRPDFAPLAAAPQPAPAPAALPVDPAIDDTAFWNATGAGAVAAATSEYNRLTAGIAPWPAAPAAKTVLDQLTFDRDLSGAADRRDWDRVAHLHAAFPAQFVCRRIGNMWTAADARRHRGELAAVADIYTAIVESCARDDRVLALRRAVDHLPPATAAQVLSVARTSDDAVVAAAAGDLTYDLSRNAIITAFDDGDDATVQRLARTNTAAITGRRDADVALFAGWSADRTAAHDTARDWFAHALAWQPSTAAASGVIEAALRDGDLTTAERVAAAHLHGTPDGARVASRILVARANAMSAAGDDAGVVALARQARRDNQAHADLDLLAGYANLRLGDLDAAATAIAGLPPTAETAAIAAQIHMRRANAAFDAREYDAALTHAQSAQRSPDLALAGLELEAWSLFHLQRYGIAAELFENLYGAAPTAAIAEGLYQSLTRINRPARLRRIAAESGGPVRRRLRWQGVID